MRILFLTALYKPFATGGAERSVEQLARELIRFGHTVGVATLWPDPYEQENVDGVEVFRIPHGGLFWMLDADQQPRYRRTLAKIGQSYKKSLPVMLSRVFEYFRPDVFNTVSLVDVPTSIWGVAEAYGVPVVHTLCDYDLVCANSGMFKNGRPCASWHLNCRMITHSKRIDQKSVTAVTSVGTWILERHRELGYFSHIPAHLQRVIFYSSDVEGKPSEVEPQDKCFHFGFLGRITLAKGVKTLVDAFLDLHHRRPDLAASWDCHFGGVPENDDFQQALRDAVQGLPIYFDGWVEPGSFLARCDVLVVSSFWAEPSPRTVVEAYRTGLPVLGAASGGIPELIGEDNINWLFEPGNALDLSRKLERIVDFGRSGLPDISKFNRLIQETKVRQVAENYLGMFRDVIDAYKGKQYG